MSSVVDSNSFNRITGHGQADRATLSIRESVGHLRVLSFSPRYPSGKSWGQAFISPFSAGTDPFIQKAKKGPSRSETSPGMGGDTISYSLNSPHGSSKDGFSPVKITP